MMAKNINKQNATYIGIIVLMHVVFFLLTCHYRNIYMGDTDEYVNEALNIKNHFLFYSGNSIRSISPEYLTQRQPGYPLFLLGIYIFTMNNWLVLVLQNLLSVFNIYYCRKLLLGIGFDKKYDWFLLLLIIAFPSQLINANTLAPDILLQTCTILYFGNFIQLWQNKKLKNVTMMSVWLVAGMMVKPVLYPFTIVHFIFIMILSISWKMKLQSIVMLALIPVCAVLLYNYSNYTRTGKFHFSSNQAFNAIYYYYPYVSATQGMDSANRFLQNERTKIDAIRDYKDRYDYANKRGITLLQEHTLPYLAFHLKNSARIFIDPGKAEMDLFTGKLTYKQLYSKKEEGFFVTWNNKGFSGMGDYIRNNASMPIVLLILLFNCIRSIGILLFFINKKMSGIIRLFTGILLSYFAIAAGPIANTRYFLPVSLIAIGCAVVGYIPYLNKMSITSK